MWYDGHDEATDESECLVLDAQTMLLVCRLAMPCRVPFGFHATWLHQKHVAGLASPCASHATSKL